MGRSGTGRAPARGAAPGTLRRPPRGWRRPSDLLLAGFGAHSGHRRCRRRLSPRLDGGSNEPDTGQGNHDSTSGAWHSPTGTGGRSAGYTIEVHDPPADRAPLARRSRRGGRFARLPQQAPPATRPVPPLTEKLGVNPAIATGVLPNGLRYYIRANKTPEHRAELRLVVNAGSILEDDTQRGFAHLVEHMAFEGTQHFPRATVIGFMQSLGMGFGPHLNAETTFDDTTYQLQVPTDQPGVLDRSIGFCEIGRTT